MPLTIPSANTHNKSSAYSSIRKKALKKDPNHVLKLGIWAYFLLVIFEGALRKWFLPGLSTPLLLIRDPIALWLILVTWQRGLLPSTFYLTGMVVIGIAGIFTATFFGHGNLTVALYGARILLIHFPMIFVIGRIFNREDVIKTGIATLYITFPMAILTALQFYSPQSTWVNRGVGGNMEGAGFNGGAFGFFRPPGTFSFTNGNVLFFSFAAPFIFYFWFYGKEVKRILLLSATAGLLIAIPLSISRTLFFEVCLTGLFAVIAISRKPEYAGKMIMAGFGMVILFLIMANTSFFKTAIDTFTTRFTGANESEGGVKNVLADRYFGTMIGAVTGSSELPFFGYGLGMGTSVGSMVLSGKVGLQIAEDEWARVIGELGLLMGLGVIFLRLALFIKIAKKGYSRLLQGDFLPWLLLSFGVVNLPQGQWAQPTALGFGILIGGLMIASLRTDKKNISSGKKIIKKNIYFTKV